MRPQRITTRRTARPGAVTLHATTSVRLDGSTAAGDEERRHSHREHGHRQADPRRGQWAEQELRDGPGRERSQLHRGTGLGHRLPGPERCGEDDDPADAPRPAQSRRGDGDVRRHPVRGTPRPRARRGGGAGDGVPPGAFGPQSSARLLPGRPTAPLPRRRGAPPGRPRRRRPSPRRRLLPRHASAPRARRGTPRGPGRPGAGRAGQRAGPEGIQWLRGFLRHLAHDQGRTVLVSSHRDQFAAPALTPDTLGGTAG